MKDLHTNFKFTECGLFVNIEYPYFGASPDGIVECDCCGRGVLEIKCPYTLKGRDIGFFLSKE